MSRKTTKQKKIQALIRVIENENLQLSLTLYCLLRTKVHELAKF